MRPLSTAEPEWSVRGALGRERRFLTSIYLKPEDEEVTNLRLFGRWQEIQENEVRYKGYFLDDAEYVIVGFGTAGRVSLSAVREARAKGIRVGLLRPITLRPYPTKQLEALVPQLKGLLVVEMNTGQMLDDVLLVSKGRVPVEFYGRLGGMVPFPDEILSEIQRMASGPLRIDNDPRRSWYKRFTYSQN